MTTLALLASPRDGHGARMQVSDQTADEIRAAAEIHKQSVTAARARLLDAADAAIASGALTTSAAAAALGVTRVTLSRELNAYRRTNRAGGGRAAQADADAATGLQRAREERDAAIDEADRALLTTIAAAVDEGRASISAAAQLLGKHRDTLSRQLAEHRAH